MALFLFFLLVFNDTFFIHRRECVQMINLCRLSLFVVLGRCHEAVEAAERAAGPGQRIMFKTSKGEEKLIDVSRVAGGGLYSCDGGGGGGGSGGGGGAVGSSSQPDGGP